MSLVNDFIKQNLNPGNLEKRVKILEETVENIVNQLKLLIKGKKRGPKPKVDSIVTDITFEKDKGCLTQSFFTTIISKKAKFISGPFANMVFELLEKRKNKLKILVGNIVTTMPNNTNYLYRPI